ncbi:MAG: hypothetical protein K6F26_02000 [Lachnospiraceae bacterium]|nr:hypothetical protein [Lachnospiraceae bacterium]
MTELKGLLNRETFDIDSDFWLIRARKPADEEHSTPYTLLDLEYDAEDVVKRISELTISEYSETLIDKDNLDPPLLFVFGKDIKGKLVYIKMKIKGEEKRQVLCVSSHYARERMEFPYA